MFQSLRNALFLATLLIASPLLAPAQSAVDGAIGGTVQDQTGSVVAKAAVLVHSNATNAEQTIDSDDSGYFRIIHLQPRQLHRHRLRPGLRDLSLHRRSRHRRNPQ